MTKPAPMTRNLTWGFLWGAIAPLLLALIITGIVLRQASTHPGEPSEVLVEWTGRSFSKPRRVEMAFIVTDPAGNAATIEAGQRYRGEVGLGMWGKVPSAGDQLRVYLPPDRFPELVPVDGRTAARGTLAILPFFWLMALLWLFVAAALHWGFSSTKPK
ncbi:hypothetical protein G3576_04080 [Roseomonas stagni]|uniref:DUF3592 domain-containing protein n=1 Tax=Falsiroseomonas algicola TaxID=2716930 RepID=A0A6M1LG61_9PROT|nr:hypothetical protein [Falsiroseomonas algicola]NGM19181.1 hypothetical protein [Falsiroseomonas algicola]